jgi:hypothetical protein
MPGWAAPAQVIVVPSAVVQAAQAAVEKAAVAEKKTRAKKADIPPPDAKQADMPSQATKDAIAEARSPMFGVFLYRGCSPVGVATVPLSAYVNQTDAAIQEKLQTQYADLRAADSQLLGFGKWPAYLSKYVKDNPPAPGHYVMVMGDAREEAVFNALISIALPGTVVL